MENVSLSQSVVHSHTKKKNEYKSRPISLSKIAPKLLHNIMKDNDDEKVFFSMCERDICEG